MSDRSNWLCRHFLFLFFFLMLYQIMSKKIYIMQFLNISTYVVVPKIMYLFKFRTEHILNYYLVIEFFKCENFSIWILCDVCTQNYTTKNISIERTHHKASSKQVSIDEDMLKIPDIWCIPFCVCFLDIN